MRVILLTKRDRFSREAHDIARQAFGSAIQIFAGSVGDQEPAALTAGESDYLISFLSPWIVRRDALDRASVAINFHPGSADYPGIGCYNFAIYDEAREFGATCHHMLPKVDTGRIILERRFPLRPDHSVETLKLDTMNLMLGMFREIIGLLVNGARLPCAGLGWSRKPYTRSEMEALKLIQLPADELEVQRRLRATIYPGFPGPVFIHPCGRRAVVAMPDRVAAA